MQQAIPVADGQVQAIRRLGAKPSPRGSRVFLGYARTKRFCLTQNRTKEEEDTGKEEDGAENAETKRDREEQCEGQEVKEQEEKEKPGAKR